MTSWLGRHEERGGRGGRCWSGEGRDEDEGSGRGGCGRMLECEGREESRGRGEDGKEDAGVEMTAGLRESGREGGCGGMLR